MIFFYLYYNSIYIIYYYLYNIFYNINYFLVLFKKFGLLIIKIILFNKIY